MAFENNQNESALPADGKNSRKSKDLLPKYFRTPKNTKFLDATLDQFVQEGVVEKINGYYGRKTSPAYRISDNYIGAINSDREAYQFEPSVVSQDILDNVNFYKDYNDYTNQVRNFRGTVDNHDRLNSSEYYAWNPNVDWDKLVNFREYYWLPTGPEPINLAGNSKDITSTWNVVGVTDAESKAFIFNSNLERNPTIELFRGQTYTFNVSAADMKFSIRTARSLDEDTLYEDEGLSTNQINEQGTFTFTVPLDAPNRLYYVDSNEINAGGIIRISDVDEATSINVEAEIIGKQFYKTAAGWDLQNGMKLSFVGDVTPKEYATGFYYVDGVGESIKLIKDTDLTINNTYSDDVPVEFDGQSFDILPFGNAASYPAIKDYIVINRATPDRNPWARNNKWFHKNVIEKTAELNKRIVDIDQSQRAKRPIIEFNSGLKLFNFGTFSNTVDIDVVDTITTDIFSDIEGSAGYNIDGVDLTDGMRVLVINDKDIRANGKIYTVKFITHNSTVPQIALIEDTIQPLENDVVLIKKGNENAGKNYWFDGTSWNLGQEKTKTNQPPLFDMYDTNGISYLDQSMYTSSTFKGTKIFSYTVGTGTNDPELGFPLVYRALENVGDITFTFDLVNDSFTYQILNDINTVETKSGFLKTYTDRTNFKYVNGWTKGKTLSSQRVVRQYEITQNPSTNYAIDVYSDSGLLDDLSVSVQVNSKYRFDWSILKQDNIAYVSFDKPLEIGDVLKIRTKSKATKNNNGWYEFPSNLSRNTDNTDLTTFTLGNISDHVDSMVEDLEKFEGIFPGNSNLGNLGDITPYGKNFLQHSGPLNLAVYHLTTTGANVVKAIEFAQTEYRRFKNEFIRVSETLGYDGPVKQHVDKILLEIFKNKKTSDPFYFSDMVPYSGAKKLEFTVYDTENNFFSLTETFDLSVLGKKAVTVYQNGTQLVHGRDYTFNDEGFVVITATKTEGDLIEVFEYESTDGCYIPQTPSKLGLYPKYTPELVYDNSYITPQNVIIGHDGSKTIAYDDYRDNLILELEKRIFNNIKQNYHPGYFDVDNFAPSKYRDTGFTKAQIDDVLIADFVKWSESLGTVDYTTNSFWDETNSFTYNYKYMSGPNGEKLAGFWRAVYQEAYDTSTPHITPWEMLGFRIMPEWWTEVYGPAPYTSDNLILWEDLEQGKIAQPGVPPVYVQKYARPGLTNHIPVNEIGELLSPLASNYAKGYIQQYTRLGFVFGDTSPAEYAWRKSSDYAFSYIKAWLLNQPAHVMGIAWDISRISKNLSGQIVYNKVKPIAVRDLVFSNVYEDTERVYTSGLVDYIINYVLVNSKQTVEQYKNEITTLKTKIGLKLAAYTDNDKLRFILDSRTPFNKGNVFLPKENYKVFLNKSSATQLVPYSGVIIEKQAYGYVVRGYDLDNPIFRIYKTANKNTDVAINVGGITETFVEWESGRRYTEDKFVRFSNRFYRTIEQHTSGQSFDTSKFRLIEKLPIRGGATATLAGKFDKFETEVPYGTVYTTLQETVDFLNGYSQWLTEQGFSFDYYNSDTQAVENWKQSIKEFMFWSTQNWSAGSVITLSPSASRFKFRKDYHVVGDLLDPFYGYKIKNSSGSPLDYNFTRLNRDGNEFTLDITNSADGVYFIELPLIQNEHVVLFDNISVFNDVIYDPTTGYKQDRIKALGYVSSDWNGSLNIPGFAFDQATIVEWEQYKDYSIGDLVKYKEFYYTATKKVTGSNKFTASQWRKLDEKPVSKLLTNFDYRVNQFTDFYDLDSDNFDAGQQKLAQHLIGYQKRQYLDNIIQDDVSQYKFYQGFIQDKGTRNSIDKLFDSLASANKESVDFHEEWAIQNSQYGATENFDEVEWQLDESKFKLEPQPVELVQTKPVNPTDLVYRIADYEVFLKPTGYENNRIPTKYTNKEYIKTVGYVTGEDVNRAVATRDGILDFDITEISLGGYIWVASEKQSWTVLQHENTELTVEGYEKRGETVTLSFNKTVKEVAVGDIFGINNMSTEQYPTLDGFYKATAVTLNKISFTATTTDWNNYDVENPTGTVSIFTSNRFDNLQDANDNVTANLKRDEIIWVDDNDYGKWSVYKNVPVYQELQVIRSTADLDSTYQGFGYSMSVNSANTVMAIGLPFKGNGEVHIYKRASDSQNFVLTQVIEAEEGLCDAYDGSSGSSQQFGESVAVSPDGSYVAVGSPQASNTSSYYKGIFKQNVPYNKADIIKYGPTLFRAIQNIDPSVSAIPFDSFSSYLQIVSRSDSSLLNLLQTADYKLNDQVVDHILIRAPIDSYEGSTSGDKIVLQWNDYSYINVQGSSVNVQPFDGEFPTITASFLNDTHTITNKVDNVLHVTNFVNLPAVGETISSSVASGTISYVANNLSDCTIYVSDVNGNFAQSGTLFVGTLRIGDYTEDYQDATDTLGGYWMIDSPVYQTSADSSNIFTDPGHGLVYQDLLTVTSGRVTPNFYYNITDATQAAKEIQINSGLGLNKNQQGAFMETLTYEGDPNEIFAIYPSNLWTVRAPTAYTNSLTIGDQFYMVVDDVSGNTDFTDTTFNKSLINKQHTVYDIWDGYIDFVFDNFNTNTQLPFEPVIGDIVKDETLGGTAEVVFYKRQFNNVRIYVKNVTGSWSAGDLYNDGNNIQRVRIGSTTYVMGTIQATSLAGSNIGKIVVIQENTNFGTAPYQELTDFEYWFYNKTVLAGIPREPNIPSTNNNDWEVVRNIPLSNGTGSSGSGLQYEGMFSVYQIGVTSEYYFLNAYTVPERANNAKLGDELQFTKDGLLYNLTVASKGDGTGNLPGSIHFIKHGSQNGISYNFEIDINENYRGTFNTTTFYKQDEIVDHQGIIYQATRNIASGFSFNSIDWVELDPGISHVGYIPNSGSNRLIGEEVFDPQFGIREFARSYDQTPTGDVLIVSSRIQGNDSTGERVVNVYRRLPGGQYTLDQSIEAPYEDLSTGSYTGFGDSISIAQDGEMIAIGEPYNDALKENQGRVYIYTQVNGEFVNTQILSSPGGEQNENFGSYINFDGNQLAVNSLQGDQDIQTTFDVFTQKIEGSKYVNDPESQASNNTTTFDNNFTKWTTNQKDSGAIYIYERINNSLLYAQEFIYEDLNARFFGKNLLVKENHVYTAMPERTDGATYQGVVIDFRKKIGTKSWNVHKQPIDQVDISNIKNVFLYNTRTNLIVEDLDFIDPVQGKIASIAEQELSFKTYYDPATYSFSDQSVVVDETNSWGEQYVGKLWWDLSAVKFYNYQQNDIIYQTNYWGEVFPSTSVQVYEWVGTDLTPQQWNSLADTNNGVARGISGQTRYDDNTYSQRLVWDPVAKKNTPRYFYWVANKKTIPNVENRRTSADTVRALIQDPAGQGYKFVALMGANRFTLFNCKDVLEDKDVALNMRYYTVDNKEQNIHNEYQILTQGIGSSRPSRDIERKWFDSLIGYDKQFRVVPDPALSVKAKYGILNSPRQSMFVNKTEALKQVIERVNRVLAENIIVDEFDISRLLENDPAPLATSRTYDVKIDTYLDLQYVGVAKRQTAILTPTIKNGSIQSIEITDAGRGYVDPSYVVGETTRNRIGPKVTVNGIGRDAIVETTIDEVGKITSVNIVDPGEGYDENTTLSVRDFTVLIESDINVANKWSLYNFNGTQFDRLVSQRFDVNLYWKYQDWYAPEYSQFTEISDLIDYSYELSGLQNNIGDTVKIKSVGSGGWLLLEKIDNQENEDYTVNYKVIGKQDATIQFLPTLYDTDRNKVGFDTNTFDTVFYDSQPVQETRIILEVLRDSLLVDNLEVEYNELFISSLRYVLAEQRNAQWLFKTSFINATHNVGELDQRVTFKNDNINSYQDYIAEVKPFKTKIRQYVSAYESTDNTNSVVTDFDLPPRYNFNQERIIASVAKVKNNIISSLPNSANSYPDKWWLDNVGFEIKEIIIGDSGDQYVLPPTVTIEGGGGTGATAKAYLSGNKINYIQVLTPGSGYTSTPDIVINGSVLDGGRIAKATAVLGYGKARGTKVVSKFDRVSGNAYILTVNKTETFTGTATRQVFDLKWPMNLNDTKVKIVINDVELLRSEYTYENVVDDSKTYSRQKGRIRFTTPPKLGANIIVSYELSPELLNAQDRILQYYDPTAGMIGKDVSQLMDGIDYGGVEVKSFDFQATAGFEGKGFGAEPYDLYDNTFEDIIVYLDGSTSVVEWDDPLENGVVYNIYKNNVRLDDPNFVDLNNTGANPNAVMISLTGDGVQTSLDLDALGILVVDGDLIVIRKTTSDGSFRPDPASFDTELTGGALSYSNAKGIDAAEIVVDGDNFITPMTTAGPEELVPGKISDTVDIQVYHRPDDGASNIASNFYTTDGVTTTYVIGIKPVNNDGILVKLGSNTVTNYTINYVDQTITFTSAPTAGNVLSIVAIGESGSSIIDINGFVADGSTNTFITNLTYTSGATHFVNIDGQPVSALLFETDETYGNDAGKFGIQFNVPPQAGDRIDYGIFYSTSQSYSATSTQTFVGDGSTTVFDLNSSITGGLPVQQNTIVTVNDVVYDAGYNIEFVVTNTREYFIDDWQFYANSIQNAEIEVYLNNELLRKNVDYRFNSGSGGVTLTTGIGVADDLLEIFVINDGQYAFGYIGTAEDSTTRFISTRDKIYFDTAPNVGAVVKLTTFSNHDSQDIARTKYNMFTRTNLIYGTESYAKYINLSNGILKLRTDALDTQYVWVILNGERLVPNVDYYLTEDKDYVKVFRPISTDDKIEYMEFRGEKLGSRFGYRIFKDILNRTHYKRLDDKSKYKLANDLNWYDTKIEIVDATGMTEPSKTSRIPGVVFINGERIEYFVKQGNTLRQLRRGTLGTGVNVRVTAGTVLEDQGPQNTIPYKDEIITTVYTPDGTTGVFELDFVPGSEHEFEVFMAGRRLRKNAISKYQVDVKDANNNFVTQFLDQDSPEGDVTSDAEFIVTGSTLTLYRTPEEEEKIVVVRRLGHTWKDDGISLADAKNDIADFLRENVTELPK